MSEKHNPSPVTHLEVSAHDRLTRALNASHPNHKTMCVFVEDVRALLSAPPETNLVVSEAEIDAAQSVWLQTAYDGKNPDRTLRERIAMCLKAAKKQQLPPPQTKLRGIQDANA